MEFNGVELKLIANGCYPDQHKHFYCRTCFKNIRILAGNPFHRVEVANGVGVYPICSICFEKITDLQQSEFFLECFE